MSGRVYKRKFDWDEARRRHAAGETIASLAREYGVSDGSVRFAVYPHKYESAKARSAAFQRGGVCVDCGGPCSRNRSYPALRCIQCAAARRVITVRDAELQCVTCREWKPDDEFAHSRSPRDRHRRERHHQCRACSTAARREYRRRHRDADNAYQRAYKARRRAEARAQPGSEGPGQPQNGDGPSSASAT